MTNFSCTYSGERIASQCEAEHVPAIGAAAEGYDGRRRAAAFLAHDNDFSASTWSLVIAEVVAAEGRITDRVIRVAHGERIHFI